MYCRTMTIVSEKVVETTISNLSYNLALLFQQNFQHFH